MNGGDSKTMNRKVDLLGFAEIARRPTLCATAVEKAVFDGKKTMTDFVS